MAPCVPCATSASNWATLRSDKISAAKGKRMSVLSSRVLSGMMARTRAPGATLSSACSRISRSSPGDRSNSGEPLPIKDGEGLLLIILLAPSLPLRVLTLALDARRSAFCESSYLFQRCHGCVAGEGSHERTMRPTELQGLLG